LNFLAKVKEIEQNLEKDKETYLYEVLDNNSLKNLSIERFSQLNIGVEIYSKVLNENIWFCSNTDMAKQIKEDVPTAVCYTVAELHELYELQELNLLEPSNKMLKGINNVKAVFKDSRIIKTGKLRRED